MSAVLGWHGLVADLEYEVSRRSGGESGGSESRTFQVSHAESLLRVLIDVFHPNANPGGSVILRNDVVVTE